MAGTVGRAKLFYRRGAPCWLRPDVLGWPELDQCQRACRSPWTRELKSLSSSEKLTPKLTRRATSWTDFRRSLFLHDLGAQNIATFPPLAQCHLLATTKRCDRPKDVTPVMGLEPATPEPHANRQRTELRLGRRARLSPSTRGTN